MGSNNAAAFNGDMVSDMMGTLSMAIAGNPPFDKPIKKAASPSMANSIGFSSNDSMFGMAVHEYIHD